MSPADLPGILSAIEPEDFYYEINRNIYIAIRYLFENKITVTLSALFKYFADQKTDYRQDILLIMDCYAGPDIKPYISSLKKDSSFRKIKILSQKLNARADDKSESPESIYQEINSEFQEIFKNQNSDITTFADMATGDIKDMASHNRYFMTGFAKFDEILHGLFQTELTYLAARPGLGKTALALNIACNIAKRYTSGDVLFFSLEMPKDQLRLRAVSGEAEVDSFIIKSERFRSNEEREKAIQGMKKIDSLSNLAVVDNKFSMSQIYIESKRYASYKNLSIIVIDYLQLIESGIKNGTKNEKVEENSRMLKKLAMELHVPVLCLSQLSREIEKRTDTRPKLSDLRDSGAIEQDGDAVWFIYQNKSDREFDSGLCEIEVAKNRNGKLFNHDFRFTKEYTKFEEV
jgi:replicative DNA helicase